MENAWLESKEQHKLQEEVESLHKLVRNLRSEIEESKEREKTLFGVISQLTGQQN
jgi:hypothetical protein